MNPFLDLITLESGSKQMVSLIKECAHQIYEDNDDLVLPEVQPGFLRNQLPENVPEQGVSIEKLIQTTQDSIFPGVMKWQSPKFFGYYPSLINVTSMLADMFATLIHSPAFNYATSPSHTELQNIVVDWAAQSMGLPQKFFLKNEGGGIIHNSASQAIFTTVQTAKFAKLKSLNIRSDDPLVLKLVGYYGEGSHLSSARALFLKDIHHRRAIPYVYNKDIFNYELDVDAFENMVEEDVKQGLIPFWCGFSYGTTFSAAIDISDRAIQICKRHNIYIQVDGSYLGSTWVSEKYRPPKKLLQQADSVNINFTKLLFNGTGGSLFYTADKKLLSESFGASALHFPIFRNAFTGLQDVVDYKDWIFGLTRKNCALKMYYFFAHYGMKMVRQVVENQQEKTDYLIQLVNSSRLLQLHTVQYGIVTFHVLDQNGQRNDGLTKRVSSKILNIKEGFSTAGEYKGTHVIRLSVGAFHNSKKHIKRYFDAIVREAEAMISST